MSYLLDKYVCIISISRYDDDWKYRWLFLAPVVRDSFFQYTYSVCVHIWYFSKFGTQSFKPNKQLLAQYRNEQNLFDYDNCLYWQQQQHMTNIGNNKMSSSFSFYRHRLCLLNKVLSILGYCHFDDTNIFYSFMIWIFLNIVINWLVAKKLLFFIWIVCFVRKKVFVMYLIFTDGLVNCMLLHYS